MAKYICRAPGTMTHDKECSRSQFVPAAQKTSPTHLFLQPKNSTGPSNLTTAQKHEVLNFW
jgi:hypothetical protein